MLCRNGLHEIDPDDPWRGAHRERCRACYRARAVRQRTSDKGRETKIRQNKRHTLNGNNSTWHAKWEARNPEKNRAINRRHNDKRSKNPIYMQSHRDTKRLGISTAEWRRQVEQGIIQLTEA